MCFDLESTQKFSTDFCSLLVFSNFSFISWGAFSTRIPSAYPQTPSLCVSGLPLRLCLDSQSLASSCVLFSDGELLLWKLHLWSLGLNIPPGGRPLPLSGVWSMSNSASVSFQDPTASWIWVTCYMQSTPHLGILKENFFLQAAPGRRQARLPRSSSAQQVSFTFIFIWLFGIPEPSFMGEVIFLMYTF